MPIRWLRKSILVLALSLILIPADPTYAQEIATSSGTVTATVPASTKDEDSPTTPILIRPKDETITGDPKPELVWKQSTDPNGNTVTYTVFIDGIATFLGVSNGGNSLQSNYTSRIESGEVRLLPLQDLEDGTYSWYVVAEDPSGNKSTSTTWQFTIDTVSPFITVNTIDSYKNLGLSSEDPSTIPEGLTYTVQGPKDIYFEIDTEPYSTIQIKFLDENGTLIGSVEYKTGGSGIATPYHHLGEGLYTVQIVSIDKAQNTAALKDFYIRIETTTITVPGITGPVELTVPPLPSLPATIQKISSPRVWPYLLASVILAVISLLIWKRRYNLIILDRNKVPVNSAIIFHSKPNVKTEKGVLATTRPPVRYEIGRSNRGRLHVQGLNRYSTLTVSVNGLTYVLSVRKMGKNRTLTIVLG